MNCENCGLEHDGTYGSGRFCSSKCARGYSTKEKRLSINQSVSKKMSGRQIGGKSFQKGYDPRRVIPELTDEHRRKAALARKEVRDKLYSTLLVDELPLAEKRRRILSEQKGTCLCGIKEWNGVPLVLELDHIDGNHSNNLYSNLRMLCPNCHSLTPFHRMKGRKRKNNASVT